MVRKRSGLYVRNIIFGIEDSLAATVGLLSGIASEQVPHQTLLLTGFVYVFVEAVSMGIGSFLSEESALEYEGSRAHSLKRNTLASFAMFAACVVGGLVPIIPYLFFDPLQAIPASIALSLGFLALLGFVQGHLSHVSPWTRMLRMVLLGGAAIMVGVVVGKIVGAV